MTTIPTANEAKGLSMDRALPEKAITSMKEAIAKHRVSVRIPSSVNLTDGNIMYLESLGYVCRRNIGIPNPRMGNYPDDVSYVDISWGH
jgi:hypothetical protein